MLCRKKAADAGRRHEQVFNVTSPAAQLLRDVLTVSLCIAVTRELFTVATELVIAL
jgi:hypothetical protein